MIALNKFLSHTCLSKSRPHAAQLFLRVLSQIEKGTLEVRTPEGQRLSFRGAETGAKAEIRIKDWKVCEMLFTKGDIGLGEAYTQELWESKDVVSLLLIGLQNTKIFTRMMRASVGHLVYYRLKHLMNRNTIEGSQKNIHAHYDLGNDFYTKWLDKTMTYSSALFLDENESLEQAQKNKYQKLIDQLKLKPGAHILEIGCGWGGFMEHAAELGYKVTGVTISKEQFDFAEQRLEKYGARTELRFQDYRKIEGEFDGIVSIEMFEALGEEYWGTYFAQVQRLLKKGGRAAIQSITIKEEDFEKYRNHTDFIQHTIFPGGMLPSPERFVMQASAKGLSLNSSFEFGLDYSKTIELWDEEFQKIKKELQSNSQFDQRFCRTWEFYFYYCRAGFEHQKTSVFQFYLTKN